MATTEIQKKKNIRKYMNKYMTPNFTTKSNGQLSRDIQPT